MKFSSTITWAVYSLPGRQALRCGRNRLTCPVQLSLLVLADYHDGHLIYDTVKKLFGDRAGLTDTGKNLTTAVNAVIDRANGEKLEKVVFTDHGEFGAMQVGEEMIYGTFITDRQRAELKRLAEHMAPDGVIEIRSCYTGSVDSLMSEIAKITGRRVVAFTGTTVEDALRRSSTTHGQMKEASPDGSVRELPRPGVPAEIAAPPKLPPQWEERRKIALGEERSAREGCPGAKLFYDENRILMRSSDGTVYEGRLVPISPANGASSKKHQYEIQFIGADGKVIPGNSGVLNIEYNEPRATGKNGIPDDDIVSLSAVARADGKEVKLGG